MSGHPCMIALSDSGSVPSQGPDRLQGLQVRVQGLRSSSGLHAGSRAEESGNSSSGCRFEVWDRESAERFMAGFLKHGTGSSGGQVREVRIKIGVSHELQTIPGAIIKL